MNGFKIQSVKLDIFLTVQKYCTCHSYYFLITYISINFNKWNQNYKCFQRLERKEWRIFNCIYDQLYLCMRYNATERKNKTKNCNTSATLQACAQQLTKVYNRTNNICMRSNYIIQWTLNVYLSVNLNACKCFFFLLS